MIEALIKVLRDGWEVKSYQTVTPDAQFVTEARVIALTITR
jgi:hypothetical protein